MCNLILITTYPKSGTIKARTRQELATRGFSHLFNDNDFKELMREQRNKARRNYTPLHFGWAALEIAEEFIKDNPNAKSDFSDYIF